MNNGNGLSGELVISADSQHLYQVIAGFVMLKRAGLVDVEFCHDKEYRLQLPASHIAEFRIAGGPRIAYDMVDGYNFIGPVEFGTYLSKVDFYFKRSFDPVRHAGVENGSRIAPFGLNYPVTVRHAFFASLDSTSGLRGLPGRAARMIAGPRALDVRRFEDVPRRNGDAQILFQTRTWDPGESVVATRDERSEREEMNELRAACVRRLRQEFGTRFCGGFMPTDYARERFADCVLDEPGVTKHVFMKRLKDADVCIATSGLHGSNGWSLGEYVAASKAIITQHLKYAVPAFLEGRNYLGFTTAAECVERVSELISSHERLYKMKVENYAYYHRYLRPDRLVLNSLLVAMGS